MNFYIDDECPQGFVEKNGKCLRIRKTQRKPKRFPKPRGYGFIINENISRKPRNGKGVSLPSSDWKRGLNINYSPLKHSSFSNAQSVLKSSVGIGDNSSYNRALDSFIKRGRSIEPESRTNF